MKINRIVRAFFYTLAGTLLVMIAPSQTTTSGSFRGTVADKSGGVVPGATVEVTDTATSTKRQTTTGQNGDYIFPKLPPGLYDFTVSHLGFRTLNSQGARLQVNQQATVDFSLDVGALVEGVTVTAAAPLLNATNATVGTVVEREKVNQLPLNGRQFTQLILLTPGATPQNSGQHGSYELATDLGAVSPGVNGQRPEMNNFTIDGVENNELYFNFVAINPPPDAIEEFKVQSYMSSSAFGRGAGANVNVSTRRGTNKYHGSLWEFIRNDKLDAHNFFDNLVANVSRARGDPTKPPFRQNQFGLTAGGPVLKDKFWLFGWYEGMRKTKGRTALGTIPPDAQLDGDFSGSPQIYNPFSTRRVGSDAGGNAIFARDPFPNNRIPKELIDPLALTVAHEFYPAPNIAAPPGQINFKSALPFVTDNDQFGVRGDATLPKGIQFFSRFTFSNGTQTVPALLPKTPAFVTGNFRQATIGVTENFGPKTVAEFHLQYLRTTVLRQVPSDLAFLEKTGLIEQFPAQVGVPPLHPSFGISGISGIPNGRVTPLGPFNNWELNGTITKIAGQHTLTFGGSVFHTRGVDNDTYGSTSFDRLATADPQNRSTTGYGLASFLLGVPSSAQREAGDAELVLHGNYYSGFLMDEWRATPKLTVTLGGRYDYASPMLDKSHRQCTLDYVNSKPGPLQPGGSYAIDGYSIWLCAEGAQIPFPTKSKIDRVPNGLIEPDRNNWSPRVSLAYRLGRDTVVRTGFGVFYDLNQSNFQNQQEIMGQWPYGQPFFLPDGINEPSVASPTPRFTLSRGIFPPFQPLTTIPSDPSFAADRFSRTPYVSSWNFGIDKAFGNDWLVSAKYLGSKGTHIPISPALNTPVTAAPGPIAPRRRLPQHGNLSVTAAWSNSSYQAGQFMVEKRYSRGLSFMMSYTWSKSLDYISATHGAAEPGQSIQNGNDISSNRGLSTFDLTHNFVPSFVYELPIGQGKPFLSGAGWSSKTLFSGWQITGILTINSGFPFGILASYDVANIGRGSQRPTLISPLLPAGFQQTRTQWFDTKAVAEIPFTFGNLGRDVIREAPFRNFDFGTAKRTKVTERVAVEFRTEFFNTINHTNFSAPGVTFSTSGFGVITSTKLPPDRGGNRVIQFGLKLIY